MTKVNAFMFAVCVVGAFFCCVVVFCVVRDVLRELRIRREP